MKLSCVETMLGETPLEEKFRLAKGVGFDGLDLRGDRVVKAVDEVRRLIERTGIEVPTIYGRLGSPLLAATASERAAMVGVIRERLRAAAAIGARWLIVVPITGEPRIALDWPGGVEAAEMALLAVLLKELASEAEVTNVRIVLEPLNRRETHLLRSPTVAADLTRRIGSPWVATMADTYHMDLEGQDAASEVRQAGEQIQLIHLSDRDRSLPGLGGIDFAPVLSALSSRGYEGYLGWECQPAEAGPLRDSVQWIRALLTVARQEASSKQGP